MTLVQLVACSAGSVECRAAIVKRHRMTNSSGGGSCRCDASCCRVERPGDEVWLISCRGLPCFSCGGAAPPADIGGRLSYWRYDWNSHRWRRADRGEFLATESFQLPTSMWVHGDRVESSEAFSQGWETYQRLVRGTNVGSVRFLIWSWPSAQVYQRRPVRDARLKAFRSNAAGYYLGGLLRELEPTTRVGLIGFSFGSRVITGSLHALAGGRILGYRLPGEDPHPPRRHNAVLMAAGVDHDWLRPGRPHGLAMTQIERLLLLNNYSDRILRFYPRLWGGQALGYVGMYLGGSMAPQAAKIRQVNAGRYVGKQHSREAYIYHRTVMAMVRRYTLYQIIPPRAVGGSPDPHTAIARRSPSLAASDAVQSGTAAKRHTAPTVLATAKSGEAA